MVKVPQVAADGDKAATPPALRLVSLVLKFASMPMLSTQGRRLDDLNTILSNFDTRRRATCSKK